MTLSNCSCDTCAPCSVPGSKGSPSRRFAAASLNFCTNSSWADSSTNSRLPAQQTSPWLKKMPLIAPCTARSMSASAKTTFGLLPPSSKVTRFRVCAALAMIVWAVRYSPVKAILSTPSCFTRASPAVSP